MIQACYPFTPASTSPTGGAELNIISPTTVTVRVHLSESLILQSVGVGLTSWPAGRWVIPLAVINTDYDFIYWESIYICRVGADCSNKGTVGSLTNQHIQLPTGGGSYFMTLNGAAQANTDPTDTFYLIYNFSSLGPPPLTVMTILSQLIITPFNYMFPIIGGGTGGGGQDQRRSAYMRSLATKPTTARLKRRLRLPPMLLTPQPPQTGPFNPSLFRNKKRSTRSLSKQANTNFPRAGTGNHFRAVLPVLFSPKPSLPIALSKRPMKRRPTPPRPKKRTFKGTALFPTFTMPQHGAMCGVITIIERFSANLTIQETFTANSLLLETQGALALVLIC